MPVFHVASLVTIRRIMAGGGLGVKPSEYPLHDPVDWLRLKLNLLLSISPRNHENLLHFRGLGAVSTGCESTITCGKRS